VRFFRQRSRVIGALAQPALLQRTGAGLQFGALFPAAPYVTAANGGKNQLADRVRGDLDRVQADIDKTEAAIQRCEADTAQVEAAILAVVAKLDAFESDWESMSKLTQARFKNDPAIYNSSLENEKKALRDKEQALRDEKKALRDKEQALRDKEQALLTERNKLSEEPGLPSLEALEHKFDSASSPLTIKLNGFEFVPTPEYFLACEYAEAFVARKPTADTTTGMDFVVVEGASGSGKTRLCWEVGRSLARPDAKSGKPVAQHVFVDCSVHFDAFDERDQILCEQAVARILFERFVPKEVWGAYRYTLETVLERIRKDTGSSFVVVQLDEYSKNPALARAIIRVCRDLFRLANTPVALIPILSGITYPAFSKELVQVSNKARAVFISLRGVENVAALKASWYDAAGIVPCDGLRCLDLVMVSFGGLPRLFEWLLTELRSPPCSYMMTDMRKESGGVLSERDATKLYEQVRARYQSHYGIKMWTAAVEVDLDNVLTHHTPRSSEIRGVAYLKRVHTLAVSGRVADLGMILCDEVLTVQGEPVQVGKCLRELSASGLFSITLAEGSYATGTVYVPLLAIDACRPWTGISSYDMSPFSYSWQWMEWVALTTLRAHWNSVWYNAGSRDVEVPVTELRPGALVNPSCTMPTVEITKELGPIVEVAEDLCGDLATAFKTGRHGLGPKVSIENATLIMAKRNQAALDGMARFGPVVLLTQC